MINFLHIYNPEPILISLGSVNIYWYGVFIVLGILAAVLVILKLTEYYQIQKSDIIDSVFYLIISGLVGARIYHIFLELPYYLENPLDIFKIWHGGLAIHGGIIAGIITIWVFSKKKKLSFWLLSAIYAPGLALAQAIGRWGNYFNQELFGKPTSLPWGIPILPDSRIAEYFNAQFFHPAFLYESLGNLLIFFIFILIHVFILKKTTGQETRAGCHKLCAISYIVLYSLLRFSLEFIRVDHTPELFGLRWPQIISLIIIIAFTPYIYKIIKTPGLTKL